MNHKSHTSRQQLVYPSSYSISTYQMALGIGLRWVFHCFIVVLRSDFIMIIKSVLFFSKLTRFTMTPEMASSIEQIAALFTEELTSYGCREST